MDNALPLHVEGLGFDSCRMRIFSFFVFVLFCFVSLLKRHIESVFCSINLLGNNVTFDSKPVKARKHFLI